jgi:hypothetical protein
MLAQKPTRRQDHSRLAEPALRHILFEPRALTWMTRVLRQSFDRDEIAALRLARRDLAGTDCLPLLENRARPANPHAAAKFRPRQGESVAQDPDERRIVVDLMSLMAAQILVCFPSSLRGH